ncbi:MAG: hypothetical protein J6N47_02355 [Lachnospiraceae bacterium]|nr:hypothetical protein [Lachnospiraceae bacterium]
MLTIKAPIELNCSRRMVSDNESFAERLQVPYKLMSSKVSGEDLLHVLNTPPEIIFAEGDNTSIFNNISNTGTFAQKTEIINHFLNTVLYNGNVELTYKDRVYITDVLMRMGVTDVKTFMSEVRNTKNDIYETQEKIGYYLSQAENFRMVLEQYEENIHTEGAETPESISYSDEYHEELYQNIFNRLKTGAVYRIINNFRKSIYPAQVENNEITLAAQDYTASQIMLNMLRENASGSPSQLIYKNENLYEDEIFEAGEEGKAPDVKNQITSSVLLDTIRNLYISQFDKVESRNTQYLDISNALYQTAGDTVNRILIKADAARTANNYITTRVNTVNEGARNIEIVQRENVIPEEAEETAVTEIDRVERELRSLTERETEEKISQLNRSEIREKRLQTESTTVNITKEAEPVPRVVKERISPEEDINLLQQQLTKINEQNVLRQDKYVEIMNNLMKQESVKERDRIDGPTATRRESVKALLDRNYKPTPSEVKPEVKKDIRQQAIMEALQSGSDDYPEIKQVIEQYVQGRDTTKRAEDETRNAIARLMHETRIPEQPKATVPMEYTEQPVSEVNIERTEKELGRITGRTGDVPGRRTDENIFRSNPAMVHRINETIDEEEIIETIGQLKKSVENNTVIKEQTFENRMDTTSVRQIENANMISETVRSDVELKRMIEQSVRQQMNTISETVVSKLENRMQLEKSRRGL